MALVGLLNVGLPYTLSAITLQLVNSTLYSILMNLIPVFSVVLAHFFLPDEQLTRRKALGVAAAVAGATGALAGIRRCRHGFIRTRTRTGSPVAGTVTSAEPTNAGACLPVLLRSSGVIGA